MPADLGELQLDLLAEAAADPAAAVLRCRQRGLAVLGIGRRRVCVALCSERVAKLAWKPGGGADNVLEWRLWQSSPPALQGLLCPARGITGQDVLVMDRCVPVGVAHTQQMADLVASAAAYGITDTANNLGLLGTRLVIFDYAMVAPARARALLGQTRPPQITWV